MLYSRCLDFRHSRTTLIVLLLIVSLGSAGRLAWEAYYEAASHRSAAENVLKDYASLIADEVIRRSSTEIGPYGYYYLAIALARKAQERGGIDSNTLNTLASGPEQVKRAVGLARNLFWLDRSGGLHFAGTVPSDDVVSGLKDRLRSITSSPVGVGYRVIHSTIGGQPQTFVVNKDQATLIGFEVDLSSLPAWFKTALSRPLLPASLGKGRITNASVHVSIRDQSGIERFRLGDRHWPELGVVKPFSETNQGVFSGSVEASIDPSVAGLLVIGGLPRSRLPALVGLLAITTGLIVAAILQLRREMALQQLRSEFVSSVSHELRTPLTQIRMFAETLRLDRIRSPEERRRSLEIIDREARRLSHLVENVLRFSRSERRIDQLACEKRELAPLISEALAGFELLIPCSEIKLEARLAGGVTAMVDSDSFRQVLLNLLDNAVKYGPRRQRVLVGLEANGGTARILVEDEGPGVPQPERRRIFERFQRLERDRQSAVAGAGIGLSVVKDLVTRHGGQCFVEEAASGGARFIVELPSLV
jgi:signal transduction histidine kinase